MVGQSPANFHTKSRDVNKLSLMILANVNVNLKSGLYFINSCIRIAIVIKNSEKVDGDYGVGGLIKFVRLDFIVT